jgi:ABC-type protease/lipase transport system fused ATPase/permease subunit
MCRRLGIHEEIEALAGGYQAELPPGGPPLPANLLRMIGLARLLIADPPILVLDDPLRGLSAPVARRLVALLAEKKRDGAILVIALPEIAATELADIALLLGQGRVLAQGPMAHVLSLGDARNMPGGPGKRSS